jgi:hypothetical protein
LAYEIGEWADFALAHVGASAALLGLVFWWPVAILAAYLGALLNAWILLVEILR